MLHGVNSGVKEGTGGSIAPSCGLSGRNPHSSVQVLEIRTYLYSVVKRYFRFKIFKLPVHKIKTFKYTVVISPSPDP